MRRFWRAARSEKWLGRVLVLVSAVVLVVVWHLWARTNSPLILPEPGPVLDRLIDYVTSGRANPHIWITV